MPISYLVWPDEPAASPLVAADDDELARRLQMHGWKARTVWDLTLANQPVRRLAVREGRFWRLFDAAGDIAGEFEADPSDDPQVLAVVDVIETSERREPLGVDTVRCGRDRWPPPGVEPEALWTPFGYTRPEPGEPWRYCPEIIAEHVADWRDNPAVLPLYVQWVVTRASIAMHYADAPREMRERALDSALYELAPQTAVSELLCEIQMRAMERAG